MKRSRAFAFAAVVAGALVAGTALAQVPDRNGGRSGPGRLGAVERDGGLPLRALNLTEAQQQQIRTLIEQHNEQHREVALRFRQAMEAHRKAAYAIPFNEQAIRSTTETLVNAQTELAIEQAKLRSDIFALLTPEQQAQAVKLRAERATRQSQRRERPGQGAPRQPGGAGL